MLAQAINQQDRSAAAQLRETLRCLSLFDQVGLSYFENQFCQKETFEGRLH